MALRWVKCSQILKWVPYKVHPPPPSATTSLLTSLPLLFHLPPPQTAHLLSHNPPGVGSLRTDAHGGRDTEPHLLLPLGWPWQRTGENWAPTGQHWARDSQNHTPPSLAPATHCAAAAFQAEQMVSASACSRHCNEGSWNFSQMAMCCI